MVDICDWKRTLKTFPFLQYALQLWQILIRTYCDNRPETELFTAVLGTPKQITTLGWDRFFLSFLRHHAKY